MAPQAKRRTQAERTETSDKAMFKATIKLLAEGGPNNVTLVKVGQEAGYSRGLVNYRFGSKTNLLKATAERILDLWMDRVLHPVHADEPGIENLEMMSKLYVDAFLKRSELMMALFRLMNECYTSQSELRPIFEEFDDTVRSRMVAQLKPQQVAGMIDKSVNLQSFAIMLIGMLRGIAIQSFINPKSVSKKEAYKMIEMASERILRPS
jgi:AcrR family transcriptional regulator